MYIKCGGRYKIGVKNKIKILVSNKMKNCGKWFADKWKVQKNSVKVFTVAFDKLNVSLLNKILNFFQKINLTNCTHAVCTLSSSTVLRSSIPAYEYSFSLCL